MFAAETKENDESFMAKNDTPRKKDKDQLANMFVDDSNKIEKCFARYHLLESKVRFATRDLIDYSNSIQRVALFICFMVLFALGYD